MQGLPYLSGDVSTQSVSREAVVLAKGIKRSEAVTSWIASHRLAMGEKKRYRQQKRVRTFRKIT